jgi:hypothetical protein
MYGYVRGTPEAPLTDYGLKLYKESSNFRVVALMVQTVGDGQVYSYGPRDVVYLAHLTRSDMFTVN